MKYANGTGFDFRSGSCGRVAESTLEELEELFVNYHDLQGEKYRILDVKGPAEALRRIADGMKTVRKRES